MGHTKYKIKTHLNIENDDKGELQRVARCFYDNIAYIMGMSG